MEPKSFFAGLFDWDFKQFVALKFIKVIYIIGAVVIGLGAISFIVAGFSRSFGAGIWAAIVGLVGGLLYLIFFRVWLEVIAMLFRIGDNTDRAVVALGGQPSGGVMDTGPAMPPSTPPSTPPTTDMPPSDPPVDPLT
jgi:hypothetical protein